MYQSLQFILHVISSFQYCYLYSIGVDKGEPRWMHYISASMMEALHDERHNIISTYYHLAKEPTCLHQTNYSNITPDVITSVCHSFYFETLRTCDKKWTFEPAHMFSVNMTILTAYVAYSDKCDSSYIGMYESTLGGQMTILDYFCGHVYMESIYSNYTVMLQMKSSMINTAHAPFLKAIYQVMAYNSAWKTFTTVSFVRSSSQPDYKPSFVFFNSGNFNYVWYLSNIILTKSKKGQWLVLHRHKQSLISTNNMLYVRNEVCNKDKGQVSIYHGLLSWYMIQWKESPIATFVCDNTSQQFILNRHIYATVFIKVKEIQFLSNIFISFNVTTERLQLKEQLNFKSTSKKLENISWYAIGSTRNANHKTNKLLIHPIKYHGFKYNIRRNIINTNMALERFVTYTNGKQLMLYKLFIY